MYILPFCSKLKTIKAVVGALRNKEQQILIARRKNNQFMGGFWELPGGKIKKQENPQDTIARELSEELGITVVSAFVKQIMSYQYTDRKVELIIYNINSYLGIPQGVEGQKISWVDINELSNYKLLPTMAAFINSIILPQKYWITPSINHYSKAWVDKFNKKLNTNIALIQLRSKVIIKADFIKMLYIKCQQYKVKLLLNITHKSFTEEYCDGWHISTNELSLLNTRPCGYDKLLGASTHSLKEALKAQNIGADFIVIAPVKATKTHPHVIPLGWQTASKIVDKINIPVYFLGGMGVCDLKKALELGAQGIAGVSGF